MAYLGIKFWHAHNQFDTRRRYRVFTLAWGRGFCPLAGSKRYYHRFLTLSVVPKWVGLHRSYDSFRAHLLGVEIYYRENGSSANT